MDFNALYAVSIIWCMAAITPGPNFFITIHTAIGTTRRFSYYTVLGIVTGTLIWAISGYMGISILFKTVPIVYISIKISGGLYLIYIGFKLILKKKHQLEHDHGNQSSVIRCFRLGLLTNLLNPKTAIFMTSLFAATMPPNPTTEYGVACTTLICSISTIWYFLVATLFSYDIAKKTYESYKRNIEKVAGIIFVGYGIKLATSR